MSLYGGHALNGVEHRATEANRPAAGVSASATGARRDLKEDLAAALKLMRERGLRASAARRLVLEALLVADGPMSAEQIAQGIGGRVASSDIASVYRNLQAFDDIGLVRHVHLGHSPGLHALAIGGEQEYLTCERCADYVAARREHFDGVRESIARAFGYRVSFSHFPLVGLCPRCAEAVDGRREPDTWGR
jgi:Fur family ferric uptake transcriptional regulator